jgi:hypothetical protein
MYVSERSGSGEVPRIQVGPVGSVVQTLLMDMPDLLFRMPPGSRCHNLFTALRRIT